jgi:hypothetical protein
MVKFSVAAEDVPLFVTDADDPAVPVVTVPTLTVAAVPFVPFVPLVPFVPFAPAAPINETPESHAPAVLGPYRRVAAVSR